MTTTSIRKRAYISAIPAATKTLAGYTALTWLQVKNIVTLGQLGFNHATIEAPDLESGIITTLKGARTGTAASMAYRTLAADPGQAAVAAANAAETEVSIQIVDPDGATASYYTGVIHSLVPNEASVTSYEGETFVFVPNHEVVKGAASIPTP